MQVLCMSVITVNFKLILCYALSPLANLWSLLHVPYLCARDPSFILKVQDVGPCSMWTHNWDNQGPMSQDLSLVNGPTSGTFFNQGFVPGDPVSIHGLTSVTTDPHLGPWFNQRPTCGDPLFVQGPTCETFVQAGTHVWRPFVRTRTHVKDLASTRHPHVETHCSYKNPHVGPWLNQGPTCGDPFFVHGPTCGTLVQPGTHVWNLCLYRDPCLGPWFNEGPTSGTFVQQKTQAVSLYDYMNSTRVQNIIHIL